MQILITTSALARTRVVQFTPWTLALSLFALVIPLMMLSLGLYHAVVLKAAEEHWPIISEAVRYVERKELARRDLYMRENLDAMAAKVGEMQARLLRLEAVSEKVASMAGMKPEELKAIDAPTKPASGAMGGPSVSTTSADLLTSVDGIQALGDRETDLLTLIESRLFEKRLEARLIPSSPPVDGPTSSGFGFRSDPFTHRTALHTGLDFPGPIGTPIMAAAGGVVLYAGPHPEYGQLVELDHGNGLVTRYGHVSKFWVKQGDLVRRGQKIAEMGSTGRSTGPHLHFEVLVEGVQQNPAKFLTARGPSNSGNISALH
ncbi:MAG: M23 family metallopeptidase [Burkholderiales bacterium]|nr:M23 family metallopeptidase [Burkholderiales bacterium]